MAQLHVDRNSVATHMSNSKRSVVVGAAGQVEAPDGVIKVDSLVDALVAGFPGGPGLCSADRILD